MEETRCIYKNDREYPANMRNYSSMPEQLYVKGKLPVAGQPAVAIVGARMCSPYGRIQAFRFGKVLSRHGIQIISGMALGIDSEGHKGALEGRTPTFAVLGCGCDVVYPARNRSLYDRILRSGGGIISEYAPGTPPMKFCFPARNRIISALADAVLVIEAKENSGSLITAGFALEMGKAVFALPGPVTENLSIGCHKLIYDGAGIAYSPEVVLQELGISSEENESEETKEKNRDSGKKNKIGLARDLNLVYSCLDLRPKSLDDIIRKTGLAPETVSRCAVELTLLGWIEETGRHYYVKVK